ncbi:MAG: SpoVR family protein [Pseudomonadota bacterium]
MADTKRKSPAKKPRKTTRKRKAPATKKAITPLFDGPDWSFDTMNRTYAAIEEIAVEDLKLDLYPNQIEIISSEQMLDAYASTGMPLMYGHWSFGKTFLGEERKYRKGLRGLAYEIIINSNPCISYNMEDNTMATQTLVMAHAAFGHNHFFKNNHLFQMWTDADGILDYLEYARNFVADCEERYGETAVERILDAAHALMPNGVFRYERPARPSLREERLRHRERLAQEEAEVNYLWERLEAKGHKRQRKPANRTDPRDEIQLPEENLLFFLEQYSPILSNWQRELLRIVRHIAQYFYPQRQTKVMNEGCACFVHYFIINRMHEKGLITDGALFEILHQHTGVITQPGFDDPRYSGTNPYALGFAIMQDIKRMCEAPTEEDREYFPSLAGSKDWRDVIKSVWANYRDESFIQQYFSPKVARDFRMFSIETKETSRFYEVSGIHDQRGFRTLRDTLAREHDLSEVEPDIQVVDVDFFGDRTLYLSSSMSGGARLEDRDRNAVLAHMQTLWGFEVELDEVGAAPQPEKVA